MGVSAEEDYIAQKLAEINLSGSQRAAQGRASFNRARVEVVGGPRLVKGVDKSFLINSHARLGELSNPDYSHEPCAVQSFDDETKKWVVTFLHPRFEGKQVKVKEENLFFTSYIAKPADLGVSTGVKIQQGVEKCGGSSLCAPDSGFVAGDRVLVEHPFLIVADDGGDPWLRRWNLRMQLEMGGEEMRAFALMFEALSDGGVVDEYMKIGKDVFETNMEASGMNLASMPPELVNHEHRLIARVCAQWNVNGHTANLFGAGEDSSAIVHHASKMNHSCDANCTWTYCATPEGAVQMVVVAARDIRPGEPLTIDYHAGAGDHSFRDLGVEKRRAMLRKRGFECQCERCMLESA
mmetsp:Transcript_13167/g.46743  ORF Transcript_13167/g.46743 Transcript_13167/m.46743 type:complete len:351 (-) Transcript_13167:450-1502(-)